MPDSSIFSRQSLILGLIVTVERLFPEEQLQISYSILDGIYAEFHGSVISPREVKQIEQSLREWVNADHPIGCQPGQDGFFHCTVFSQKIHTLYPPVEHSGAIRDFALYPYSPGFVLHFPSADLPDRLLPFVPPEKLSATFSQTHRWLKNLQLAQVADLNQGIEHHPEQLICLAEALHEKNISGIADRILDQRKHIRVILISGPSSSGKTTFAERLSIQLRVNGLRPISLSLDNYFLSRDKTPRDANGQFDFESLDALNLPLLDAHLSALIRGEEVITPVYDFVSGSHREGKPLKLEENNILVIEGIHGLNPRLIPSLDRNQLFRIYVSALFQLNIDDYNRVPTTQVRLIRRLVRDNQFRGITIDRTLHQWPSVRRGENNNIFPYQEEADVMFNSSLLYELNVLRPFAEPLLASVPKDSPHYPIAQSCLRLLSFFVPVSSGKVPFNSILREFLGESIFMI